MKKTNKFIVYMDNDYSNSKYINKHSNNTRKQSSLHARITNEHNENNHANIVKYPLSLQDILYNTEKIYDCEYYSPFFQEWSILYQKCN